MSSSESSSSKVTQLQEPNTKFPLFYRITFVIFDILFPLFGVFGNLFAPAMILNGYTPYHISPIATETQVLLDAMAGFFASLAYLQVYFLLTRPRDMTIWKALQGATLLVDAFMLLGFVRALHTEGRLATSSWRGDDYGNIVGYVGIAVVRLAFLLGVGLGGGEKRKTA